MSAYVLLEDGTRFDGAPGPFDQRRVNRLWQLASQLQAAQPLGLALDLTSLPVVFVHVPEDPAAADGMGLTAAPDVVEPTSAADEIGLTAAPPASGT